MLVLLFLYDDCVNVWFIAAIFLLYAKLEEEHGLARHAMSVYDRATKAVLPEEQHEVGSSTSYLLHFKLWKAQLSRSCQHVHNGYFHFFVTYMCW